MSGRNLLGWLFFFCAGVWLQHLYPGLDFLLPGVLVSLGEGRVVQTLCVSAACVLIQEGLGTLDFGAAILWYLSVTLVFLLGRYFFRITNILFAILVAAASGVTHFGITQLMCMLQQHSASLETLGNESLQQALALIVTWKIFAFLRHQVMPHAQSS
ncbi:MAG: hypothetical protein J5828_04865 [Desulfovibrionaceae bacterium]|nr:hypothetical protein [Desulfovibrionaceae bacterium]